MRTKPCLRCGRLTDATYCPACQAARWADQDQRRGQRPWYGSGWAKISAAAVKAQPWCSWCGATTDLTTDHVIPRSLAGGVQVLCQRCNNRKAAAQRVKHAAR